MCLRSFDYFSITFLILKAVMFKVTFGVYRDNQEIEHMCATHHTTHMLMHQLFGCFVYIPATSKVNASFIINATFLIIYSKIN